MARLACFYNTLDPRTGASLARYAPASGLEVEWADTSASQQEYARQLGRRWAGGEDLILVEQDKEIYPSTLPELAGCGELVCGYTSWVYPVPHTQLSIGSFGVIKFSAAVRRLIPVAGFAGAAQLGIDRRFFDLALSLGIGLHLHGHVVHHHVYEPRPAAVREHVARLRARGILPPAVYPEPDAPHLLPGSRDIGKVPDAFRPGG